MGRRERMERRLEQRREWADKASERSAQHFDTAHDMGDRIPFGQPILVGHHSERADRRYRGRIDSHMDHAVEERHKAEHHAEVADTLEKRLDSVIFSDDDDAIEQLQVRIADTQAKADTLTGYNKAWRKHKSAAGMIAAGIPETVAIEAEAIMRDAYSWVKSPFSTDHLRAAIRQDKERIEEVRTQQAQHEAAEAAGAVLIERNSGPDDWGGQHDYARVTFAEKPDREIITALKEAGFWWSSGSWHGKASQIPQVVADLSN